jgi:hypothetical protein
MKKSLLKVLSAAVMTVAGAVLANASITVSNPVVSGGGPNFTWAYGISGDGQEQLNATVPTFFTIYDFAGYVAGSIFAPAGWTATTQLVGTTPSGQIIPDSPSILNLVFTYNGAIAPVPTIAAGPSGFGALSTLVQANPNGFFTYQAQKITNLTASDQGQGPTSVPTAIPEPLSMTMLGGGLALIGMLRFRRK